jgi:hypothetical protein
VTPRRSHPPGPGVGPGGPASARSVGLVSIDLPYVDEHAITIAVPRDLVWPALRRYAATSIGVPDRSPLALLLGTAPPSGFGLAEAVPGDRLTLTGRHRFSRYALVFELHAVEDGSTVLRAKTYAEFPGLRGRIYRALVIGTGAHVLATNHMLRAIQRLSQQLILPADGAADAAS